MQSRFSFPQASIMVLPPPAGQGLQMAEFARFNRRFLMDSDKEQLEKQFSKDVSNLYQVSGIAHWRTPNEYRPVLGSDDKEFVDGVDVAGVPIIGLFARLSDAVGGGLCYHPECCAGLVFCFLFQNAD